MDRMPDRHQVWVVYIFCACLALANGANNDIVMILYKARWLVAEVKELNIWYSYFWTTLNSPLRPDRLWGPPSYLSSGYRG
jgi:hypothetical protein